MVLLGDISGLFSADSYVQRTDHWQASPLKRSSALRRQNIEYGFCRDALILTSRIGPGLVQRLSGNGWSIITAERPAGDALQRLPVDRFMITFSHR
jgi:hypothetical protein